jgi:hypothetical protein
MHVLVEGRDDREFVNAVIRPMLQRQYDDVQVWEYAGETITRRMNYIRSIQATNADYLFMADLDTSPCITERKNNLVNGHRGMIDAECAVVVVKEIESWYLAGVDEHACQEFGIPNVPHTDHVTKEQFRSRVPRRFNNFVVNFMMEILRGFQIEVAKGRNRSFGYLMNRLETRSKEVE